MRCCGQTLAIRRRHRRLRRATLAPCNSRHGDQYRRQRPTHQSVSLTQTPHTSSQSLAAELRHKSSTARTISPAFAPTRYTVSAATLLFLLLRVVSMPSRKLHAPPTANSTIHGAAARCASVRSIEKPLANCTATPGASRNSPDGRSRSSTATAHSRTKSG
jgi:hypothetical protein